MADPSDMSNMSDASRDIVDSTVEAVNMSIGFKNGIASNKLVSDENTTTTNIKPTTNIATGAPPFGSTVDDSGSSYVGTKHLRSHSSVDFGGFVLGQYAGNSYLANGTGSVCDDDLADGRSAILDFDTDACSNSLLSNGGDIFEEWRPIRRVSIANGHIPVSTANTSSTTTAGQGPAMGTLAPSTFSDSDMFGGTTPGATNAMSIAMGQSGGSGSGSTPASPSAMSPTSSSMKLRRGSNGERDHLRLVNAACRHIAAAAAATAAKAAKNGYSDDECDTGSIGSASQSSKRGSAGGTGKTILKRKKRRGGIMGFKELAAKAGLSPWHFHRVFRSVTGLTPKAYGEACWNAVVANNSVDTVGHALKRPGLLNDDQSPLGGSSSSASGLSVSSNSTMMSDAGVIKSNSIGRHPSSASGSRHNSIGHVGTSSAQQARRSGLTPAGTSHGPSPGSMASSSSPIGAQAQPQPYSVNGSHPPLFGDLNLHSNSQVHPYSNTNALATTSVGPPIYMELARAQAQSQRTQSDVPSNYGSAAYNKPTQSAVAQQQPSSTAYQNQYPVHAGTTNPMSQVHPNAAKVMRHDSLSPRSQSPMLHHAAAGSVPPVYSQPQSASVSVYNAYLNMPHAGVPVPGAASGTQAQSQAHDGVNGMSREGWNTPFKQGQTAKLTSTPGSVGPMGIVGDADTAAAAVAASAMPNETADLSTNWIAHEGAPVLGLDDAVMDPIGAGVDLLAQDDSLWNGLLDRPMQ